MGFFPKDMKSEEWREQLMENVVKTVAIFIFLCALGPAMLMGQLEDVCEMREFFYKV